MLVDSLLENDALGLLVHRLSAFDEKVGMHCLACSALFACRLPRRRLRSRWFCLFRRSSCYPCMWRQQLTELPAAARAAYLQVAEEASAVYNVLAIIENLIEVKPAIAEQVVEKTKVRGNCTRCCCPIY